MATVSSLSKIIGKNVKLIYGSDAYEGKVVDVIMDNYYMFVQLDDGRIYNCKFIGWIELSE